MRPVSRPASMTSWVAAQVQRDLGTGVAGTDNEDRTVSQLSGVAVIDSVQRTDARIELVGDIRHPRAHGRSGRDHHCVRSQAPAHRRDQVTVTVSTELIDPPAQPDWKREPGRVGPKLFGHLIFRRQASARARGS